MPFTLYHSGPSALIALPLRKFIDIPVFIFANVIVDIEVLVVAFTRVQFYAGGGLHPIAHTYLFGTLIAIVWGVLSSLFLRKPYAKLMTAFRLDYQTNTIKIIASALLGVWFHIFVDCMYHKDLHPLYPFSMSNPLNFRLDATLVKDICRISFVPAVIFYFVIVIRRERRIRRNAPDNSFINSSDL